MVTVSFAQCNFLAIISEAVPKRILELMNVPGLTRENVASHLQVWFFPTSQTSIIPCAFSFLIFVSRLPLWVLMQAFSVIKLASLVL